MSENTEEELDPRFKANPETDPEEPARDPGAAAPSVKEGETEADEELPPDQETFQTDSS